METVDNQWVFGATENKRLVNYYILQREDISHGFRILFDVQLPKDILSRSHYTNRWSDIVQEYIQADLKAFVDIFPQYMMDICLEHNGIERMTDFPNYGISHIAYTPSCIGIGGDGTMLQIAGCHPDDVGEKFTENFVKGLKGDWKGISFGE